MCLVVCMCVYTQLLSAWWPSPWSNEVHQHIILYALVSAFPTTLSWCPQTEKKLFVTNMISIKRCDVTESHMGERLKSSLPNFEKSLMKHYAKLEWVGRKCPASSQAPPNKDFRNHECSYIQFFHWGKGRRLALNSQSLIPGLSHQLSLFCSVFFYELSPRLCFVDIQQALYLHQRRNWKYYVYTMFILRFLPRFVSSWELELASNGNSGIGPSQSISQSSQPHKFPPTHTLARSTWIHFEHSPVRSWSPPSPLPKCELTGAPAPVEAAQVCLRVPHFAPHSVPPSVPHSVPHTAAKAAGAQSCSCRWSGVPALVSPK